MASLNLTDLPRVCNKTVTKLFDEVNSTLVHVTSQELDNLRYFCYKGYISKKNEKFSEPMVVIGVYIAVASLFCILGVVADSLRGILWRKDRYQIPSKYFSLNVTSMTLITIAMKLPMDLSASMPGNLDQVAKIGSIAFMCTVLAILNPSLASMDNKELCANILGLVILVVTISVNLFIEIGTGVISNEGPLHVFEDDGSQNKWKVENIYYSYRFQNMAGTYIGIMILLLHISISTAIIIPSFKKTLEFKYDQVRRKLALIINDQKQQHSSSSTRITTTVEEVTKHVTRFWIMAKTGSPQFVMARNILSYASLVLCVVGIVLYALVINSFRKQIDQAISGYQSDYKWSIPFILIVQFIYSLIGTLVVIIRCIKSTKFREFSLYSPMLDLRKLEKYWTEKLCEWKGSRRIGFLPRYPRLREFVYCLKRGVLSLCIWLQKAFVVFICLVAMFGLGLLEVIIMMYDALKKSTKPVVSRNDDDDLGDYVLQLDDEVQASQKVVENLSLSMNRLIERSAKKKQNNNLLELLGKYYSNHNGFKGVESFDDDDIGDQKLNSWSVPIITLACIAVGVPDISKEQLKSLIQSIDEALLYTHPVEESFDRAREFVNIRKKAVTFWEESVRDKRWWWLENPIGNNCKCGKIPPILTWFKGKAGPILKGTTGVHHMIDSPNELDVAGLMHRVKRSIASKYPEEIQMNERFFQLLCSLIADILVACFSNLPRVIMMKCHANEIEKREASVEAAVKLLGRSREIIEKLEGCQLPAGIDPDKRASIDEWIIHLKQSSIP